MARRSRPLLIALVVLAAAGPALADGAKPRPTRVIPAAKPAPVAKLRPSISFAPPPTVSLPPPGQPGGAFGSGMLASNGLASGGLRSGLPVVGDPAAQCRTTCTRARITCDAEDASPECSPRWAMCVAACTR